MDVTDELVVNQYNSMIKDKKKALIKYFIILPISLFLVIVFLHSALVKIPYLQKVYAEGDIINAEIVDWHADNKGRFYSAFKYIDENGNVYEGDSLNHFGSIEAARADIGNTVEIRIDGKGTYVLTKQYPKFSFGLGVGITVFGGLAIFSTIRIIIICKAITRIKNKVKAL